MLHFVNVFMIQEIVGEVEIFGEACPMCYSLVEWACICQLNDSCRCQLNHAARFFILKEILFCLCISWKFCLQLKVHNSDLCINVSCLFTL